MEGATSLVPSPFLSVVVKPEGVNEDWACQQLGTERIPPQRLTHLVQLHCVCFGVVLPIVRLLPKVSYEHKQRSQVAQVPGMVGDKGI